MSMRGSAATRRARLLHAGWARRGQNAAAPSTTSARRVKCVATGRRVETMRADLRRGLPPAPYGRRKAVALNQQPHALADHQRVGKQRFPMILVDVRDGRDREPYL